MRHSFQILLLLCLFSCTENESTYGNFLANYSDYCGHAYEGAITLANIGGGEAFKDARLLMELKECNEKLVRIPFLVDDNRSRTWILQIRNGSLHLSHDHRYEDGSEHNHNFYGGFATDQGSVLEQFFPADEKTIADRPSRHINTWSKEFDLSQQSYYYRLYLNDELRFEAVFDLSNPLPIN